MSKAWGNIGAWAAEAELAEAEEREAAASAATNVIPEPQNFPSLREAATTKPKKKKMTLNEFYTAGSSSTGLTPNEMLRLPTGPKEQERSAEELQYGGRLGGGFSSYGRSGQPPNRMRDREDGEGSWGGGGRRSSAGGFDDEGRGRPSRVSDFDQPSRADEVDNWAMAKKPLPSLESNRSNRYNSLGSGSSRADEVDNWAAGKRPQPAAPAPAPSRYSSFGSGFRDSGAGGDRWARGEVPSERPRLVLAPPKENSSPVAIEPVKTNRSNPFGAARPREEILAEKGLDYKKLDLEIEAKATGSRPTSAHSSRPSSAQSNRSESIDSAVKPRPKVNPFGDAKPREVLLEQKGLDWRKIDLELEHRSIDRPESEQEKILKEEIDNLKREWEREVAMKRQDESPEGYEEDESSITHRISQKEKELELLVRDLDDKVRFGQKGVERPVSRSGSVSSFSERPDSRSGSFDESRSVDQNDRPSSRGSIDARTRPNNERRTFQGGRERGYFPNRDIDRSRPRW